MNKLFSTKYYHVVTNKRKKTLRVTDKHFNTKTEGIQMVKTGMVLKPKEIKSMLSDGWKEYKEPWKPKDLHDEGTESAITAYEERMRVKNEREERLKPKFEEVEPFNYEKRWNKYIKGKKKELEV